MIKLIIASIFYAFSSLLLSAQNLDQTLKMAESYAHNGQLDLAIVSYQRVLFFDSAQRHTNTVYRGLADSYYHTAQFNLAEYFYDLAYFSAINQSEANYCVIQKTASLLQRNQPAEALAELYSLPDSLSDLETFQYHFYTSYAFFGLKNYSESRKNLTDYLTANGADQVLIEQFDFQFAELEKAIKNPKRAKLRSQFIPGWGQFYTGDRRSAFNSFLLVGSLGAAGLISMVNIGVLDAATTFGPWFYRYYSGGYNKAEAIAIRKNQENSSRIFKEILDDWMYFYHSKKE